MSSSKLIKYLKTFIANERDNLFEEKLQQRTNHITIVLENIFQGRNISASIRSADCFGIQNVHIIENDNLFNDDKEVSMGSEKWITTKRYNQQEDNSMQAIKGLKSEGYQVIAVTPHNTDCNLFNIDVDKQKIALIFGAEVHGCSKQTLELADKRMKIPMYGFTESFNISVAVSLCLQHLTYKLRKTDFDWKMSMYEQEIVMLQWLRNSIKASVKIEEEFLNSENGKK